MDDAEWAKILAGGQEKRGLTVINTRETLIIQFMTFVHSLFCISRKNMSIYGL